MSTERSPPHGASGSVIEAMIGKSRAFRHTLAMVDKIAPFDVPVLIEGETGTGKEIVARAIHYRSERRSHPFVPVNCGSLPETLIENELFGHRRGAFTDARESQVGLVALASSGTLFLDEIDAFPAKGQVALLRFLQDQLYRPLGDGSESRANVRVIAATNRDLSRLCENGAFRIDLYYRLRVLDLRLPPLRERHGDVRLLAEHFVAQAAAKFQKAIRPFSSETLAWFERYPWPGNVRELEHLVYREFLLGEGAVIRIVTGSEGSSAAAEPADSASYREAKARAIARFEADFLARAMERAGGNVSVAARLIRTERRHLGRLLKKHNLRPSAP